MLLVRFAMSACKWLWKVCHCFSPCDLCEILQVLRFPWCLTSFCILDTLLIGHFKKNFSPRFLLVTICTLPRLRRLNFPGASLHISDTLLIGHPRKKL